MMADLSQGTYQSIEQELVALFHSLESGWPPGTARVEVKITKGGGTIVELNPTRRDSAVCGAHAENGIPSVDFYFGDFGTTFDLPSEGQFVDAAKDKVLDEVRELANAVVSGKCEERVHLFGTSGEISVDGRKYRVTNLMDLHPLKLMTQRRRTYAPYI
jgi:hypothetical protein